MLAFSPSTCLPEIDILIDPKVRDQVHGDNLSETALVTPVSTNGEGGGDTDVRQDDLPLVACLEDDGRRGEVCIL